MKEKIIFGFGLLVLLILIIAGTNNTSVSVSDGVLRNESGDSIIENNSAKVTIVGPLSQEGYVFTRPMETSGEKINLKLIRNESTATLNQSLELNDEIAYFNTGHGIAQGDTIRFYCNNRIVQINAESVSGNNITLAMFSDINCSTSDYIEYGRANAAVVANLTDYVEFCFTARFNQTYHINKMVVTIRDATAMDDGTFGGMPQLDFPVFWRVYNGYVKNLFPVSRNGAARLRGATIEYPSKAPAGQYAVGYSFSFGGAENNGAVIELDGQHNDRFCMVSREDLTDLLDLETVIIGHYGEAS